MARDQSLNLFSGPECSLHKFGRPWFGKYECYLKFNEAKYQIR